MEENTTDEWMSSLQNAIASLQGKYKKNRGMLLTEGDLECFLFNELMNQDKISAFHQTKQRALGGGNAQHVNLKASFIHSQVTWFKANRKSGYEVDLTILNPAYLDVRNINDLLNHPHKGFAYDGPCIAIELKFIREANRASRTAYLDLLKLINKVIPDKLRNIDDGTYKFSNSDNIKFVSIVGCKDKATYDKARYYLGRHLKRNQSALNNIHVCVFYQDETTWDIKQMINDYNGK